MFVQKIEMLLDNAFGEKYEKLLEDFNNMGNYLMRPGKKNFVVISGIV